MHLVCHLCNKCNLHCVLGIVRYKHAADGIWLIAAPCRFNPDINRLRVIRMLTTQAGREAYIRNVLTPLVKDLRKSKIPGTQTAYADTLLAYEIFNEAEGVSLDTRLYHNYM